VPRVVSGPQGAPVPARRPGVVIPGVYAKLIARARAEYERGDAHAVLIEDLDEAEGARHDPHSPIVAGALKELAALETPVVASVMFRLCCQGSRVPISAHLKFALYGYPKAISTRENSAGADPRVGSTARVSRPGCERNEKSR
jgi:hypothetical protein